jgi:signal peptidase I
MIPRTEKGGGKSVIVNTGQLYIDGVPYDEPYAVSRVPTIVAPWKLNPGRYYVMGDNRDVSLDSRVFGGVPRELIHGVAYVVVWPLSRVHAIPRQAVKE